MTIYNNVRDWHSAEEMELANQLTSENLYCYRYCFLFGDYPGFCNVDSTKYRFIYRFVNKSDKVEYQICTPKQLLQHLLQDWRPCSHQDQDYAAFHMRKDLESLPE